jgi:hypothetical protein
VTLAAATAGEPRPTSGEFIGLEGYTIRAALLGPDALRWLFLVLGCASHCKDLIHCGIKPANRMVCNRHMPPGQQIGADPARPTKRARRRRPKPSAAAPGLSRFYR